MLDYAILVFATLFTVMNPISIIPAFIGLTPDLSTEQRRQIALRAVITSSLILLLFGVGGRFIFDFFGINVNSMRVVGGIILFGVGYEMLGAKLSRTTKPQEDVTAYMRDISITPLAIPLMTGPGAIATIIVHVNSGTGFAHYSVTFLVAALVEVVIFITLVSGERIMARLGQDGNNVLMRVMGLILMVIAVELVVAGLTPIVRAMLMIEGA